MLLFVGLGNPGPDYVGNRHNIGFMALETVAKRHGIAPWRRRFFFYWSCPRVRRGRRMDRATAVSEPASTPDRQISRL